MTLGVALAACIAHYWLMRLRAPYTLERRALWLHFACRRVMAAMGVACRVEGQVPTHGLVVANHLSHIDIVILGAIMPCFFVAKAEVGSWPYFGRAAQSGGALFIDRSRRSSADEVAREIAQRLKLSVPVLLFPEGTSTDGSVVLRFHTGLFEPAVAARAPVTAAAIRYVIDGGIPERELCWFGDALFLPHLLRVLRTKGFCAEVHFGAPRVYASRRMAAQATHGEIAAMRGDAGPRPEPDDVRSLSQVE